jgi:hypothetical protein
MITETAEQIAFRFLVDMHNGDTALIESWRREARREWCLTLQLCVSFMDEIERSARRKGT